MIKINNGLSNFLYFMRWVAAFFVATDHIRTNYFIGISQIQHNTILTKIFFLFTFLGHNSVIVFFVLSGFFVGGGMFKEFKENKFSLKKYFIKRFTRLYIVLIPALILGGLFAYFIFLKMHINCNTCDIKTFFGNLFYLETIYVKPFANNEPLWSLAYEAWYYLLFPIIIYLIFSKKIIIKILNFFIFLFLLILLKPNLEILLYMLIWLLGVFVFFYNKRILSFRLSIFLFLLVFVLYRVVTIKTSPFYIKQGFVGDFILGISVMLLINSAKYSNLSLKFFNFNKIMADFSYTLYLVHVPILYFLLTYISKANSFDIYHISIFIVIVTLIYFYAYVVAFLTEKHTKKVTKFLLRKFS